MTHSNVIQFPIHRSKSNENSERAIVEGVKSPLVAPEKTTGHDSNVFDITRFQPHGRDLHLLESGTGTLHIPHKILELMVKATTSKVDLIVFACLVRYTLGFQRSKCEASHTFISEWTGLPIPSIRRGLDFLLSAGLIERVSIGSSLRDSTVYEIPVVRSYLACIHANRQVTGTAVRTSHEVKNPESKTETPNPSPITSEPGSKRAEISDQNEHRSRIILSTKKETINNENKSLSPDAIFPKFLETYFSNLKPDVKHQREMGHFRSLQKDYPLADISDAAQLLVEQGIPSKGEPCHSPMAYLAVSMANTLAVVKERREKQKRRIELAAQEERRREEQAKREKEEENSYAENLALFYQDFPTAELQENYFRKFATDNPMFAGGSFLLKNLAICAWADSQKNHKAEKKERRD